jgi:hypothetical protein
VKVPIEVTLRRERIIARVVGTEVSYEGPNRVAIVVRKGREEIAAVGDDSDDVMGARIIDGVAVDRFDPAISAGLVGYLGLSMWSRVLRPGWRGARAMLDRVDVRVSIERYDGVPTDPDRRHPRLSRGEQVGNHPSLPARLRRRRWFAPVVSSEGGLK